MARVVILSFTDNLVAEKFIHLKNKWENDEATADSPEEELLALGAILSAGSVMEAVVARPTVWCRCTKGFNIHGKGGSGYTKTEKFGWWIHAKEGCQRPSYPLVRDFIKNMIMASGHNLLPAMQEEWNVAQDKPQEAEAAASGGQAHLGQGDE